MPIPFTKRLLPILIALGSILLNSSRSVAAPPPAAPPDGYNLYLPLVGRPVPQDWIGPDGGVIAAVVFDPQNPANVYAGSWGGGVYKSLNGGAAWKRASQGLGNIVVVSLAIDPANPAVLYAGTYRGGIYKSTDSAATWSEANSGIQEQAIVYSIVIDPQNTQRLYAATRGFSNNNSRPWAGVVYRSEDGGASWSPSLDDLGGSDYQDWAYALEINPNDPNIIFAATHEHGPVRSRDNGATWKVLTNGITNHSTRAVVIDPRPDYKDYVYTGVWTKDGVFKSTDGGGTWELKSDGIGGANIYGMAINPFAPRTLYAATFNMGVMKSSNAANTWSGGGLEQASIATVRVSPFDGQTVFAGTAGDGLYLSRDGGGDWDHSQTHLSATSVTSLVASPLDASTYYASLDGGGVQVSADRGQSWSEFSNHLGDKVVHALVQQPASPTLFALTDSAGLYRCDLQDSAACWQSVGLSGLAAAYPASLPTQDLWPASRENFLSLFMDPLESLSPRASAPLLSMAFAPSDPNTAYIGSGGAGMYKSGDGGISWAPAGWNDASVWSIAVHPLDPNLLFAAGDPPGTLRLSLDGGASWQDASLPGLSVFTLAIPPTDTNALLAGTSDGLYQLKDGAWTRVGFAGQAVTVLAIHPARPSLFAAVADGAAWVSTDAGRTWLPAPAELQGAAVQSISFSPDDPDLIFYSTVSNGVLRAGIGY